MGAVAFYIFYGFSRVLAFLPLRILYILSDITYPLIYYIVRYRRNVVKTNLKNSFPEKSEDELKNIGKSFYRHFCDLFIETIKLTHMSNKQQFRRIPLTNPGVFEKLFNEKRDAAIITGHYGNWEWTNILPRYTRHRTVPVYKPLKNKYFDRFMLYLRSKNDCDVTPMSKVIREIVKNRNLSRPAVYGFMADQTPPWGEIQYWTTFMNQDTPVYLGTGKIASKYDMAVVFLNVQKIRRGYYEMTAELLFENTRGISAEEITERHVKRLEIIIRDKPEYWLWSHRRWKHKREDQCG